MLSRSPETRGVVVVIVDEDGIGMAEWFMDLPILEKGNYSTLNSDFREWEGEGYGSFYM